jgi:hypothetical protein
MSASPERRSTADGTSDGMSNGTGALDQPSLPIRPVPHRTRLSGLYAHRRPTLWSLRPEPVPSTASLSPGLPAAAADGRRPGVPPAAQASSATPATGAEAAAAPAPAMPGAPSWPLRLSSEHLRLDVDGHDPQMTASGTIRRGLSSLVHWIASLTASGPRSWQGTIWYRDGDTATLPHTDVSIVVTPQSASVNQRATVVFSGGAARRVVSFHYLSPYFHEVEVEFDATADAMPVTRFSPGPADDDLSVEEVFRRTGLDVRTSAGSGSILPLAAAAGAVDDAWTDGELHDAMQTYWSRFSSTAPRALWVLWAHGHEAGPGLAGITFDDLGPEHRQGTAIFTGSVEAAGGFGRMQFWSAIHQMGHAFDLGHSWQKDQPLGSGTPWMPFANEPEARSFMNHPSHVRGQEAAFFDDFGYRFDDPELMFVRHAPERRSPLGDAGWFEAAVGGSGGPGGPGGPHGEEPSPLRLAVRANRPAAVFDFLEPVVLELKLTNVSAQPLVIDRNALAADGVVAVVERQGRPSRQWVPYARRCRQPDPTVLAPGQSLYESLPVYAGRNGWDVSEPGVYRVRAALEIEEQPIVSPPLTFKVRPPAAPVEEYLAQDLFGADPGRPLAFWGTTVMPAAIAALEAVVERAPDSRAALHAEAALAAPLAIAYKVLDVPGADARATSASQVGARIRARPPRIDEAAERLQAALVAPGSVAAETFGHVGYRHRVERLGGVLARNGDLAGAARTSRQAREVLAGRGVLAEVVDDMATRAEAYDLRAGVG